MQKTTVLLADDHRIVREGLRALLAAEHDIEVVGEAETGRQAVRLTTTLKPDVVVMDIAMPLLNGLEASRQISHDCSKSRVLILSSYCDDEYVEQLPEIGAAGYLVKNAAAAELVSAIREVKNGNVFLSPSISKQLVERIRATPASGRASPKRHDTLTAREVEVLQLVAEGKANKQISYELKVSIKTVEKHRQKLMNKLGIHDVAGLTRYAIAKGIIEA